MGQKVQPNGLRLGIIRDWNARWYASKREYAKNLAQDMTIREYLKNRLANAAVSNVTIERPAQNLNITVHTARPGIVIGKKGEDIDRMRRDISRMTGLPVQLSVEEIRKPELDASLVAESICQQLEKRIMFRRAMKRAVTNAMRLGAQGVKVMVAGRPLTKMAKASTSLIMPLLPFQRHYLIRISTMMAKQISYYQQALSGCRAKPIHKRRRCMRMRMAIILPN